MARWPVPSGLEYLSTDLYVSEPKRWMAAKSHEEGMARH